MTDDGCESCSDYFCHTHTHIQSKLCFQLLHLKEAISSPVVFPIYVFTEITTIIVMFPSPKLHHFAQSVTWTPNRQTGSKHRRRLHFPPLPLRLAMATTFPPGLTGVFRTSLACYYCLSLLSITQITTTLIHMHGLIITGGSPLAAASGRARASLCSAA